MFSLFKKDKENKNDENHLSLTSVAALLIHSAKIDENFTEKERSIIKKALIEMGADEKNLDQIIKDAELKEKDSNQILEFTKEVKNKITSTMPYQRGFPRLFTIHCFHKTWNPIRY